LHRESDSIAIDRTFTRTICSADESAVGRAIKGTNARTDARADQYSDPDPNDELAHG
jgi:hypothetical protein